MIDLPPITTDNATIDLAGERVRNGNLYNASSRCDSRYDTVNHDRFASAVPCQEKSHCAVCNARRRKRATVNHRS